MPSFICSPGAYAAGVGYVSAELDTLQKLTLTLPHPPYHMDPITVTFIDLAVHMEALPTQAYCVLWTAPETAVTFDIAPLLAVGDNDIQIETNQVVGSAALWSVHIESTDIFWVKSMELRTAACPPEIPPPVLQFTGVVDDLGGDGVIEGSRSLDGRTLYLSWHDDSGGWYTSKQANFYMTCSEPISWFLARWSQYSPKMNWYEGGWPDLNTGGYDPVNTSIRNLIESGPDYAIFQMGWGTPKQPTCMYARSTNTLRYPVKNGVAPSPYNLQWSIEILSWG